MRDEATFIYIVILGENHKDPAVKLAILYALKKCQEQQIPFVFCAERPYNTSLEIEYQKECEKFKYLSSIIETSLLQDLFYTPEGKLLPFFDLSRQNELIERLKICAPEGIDINQIAGEIIGFQYTHAKKNLLNYLYKNKLPYLPIDIMNSRQMMKAAFAAAQNAPKLGPVILSQTEKLRIETMTNNILEAAKSLKKGIVFVNTGSLHVQNLVASLTPKDSLEIIPLYGYSDFKTDFSEDLEAIGPLFSLNSNRVKKEDLELLHFKFQGNRLFINKRFNEILTSLIQRVKNAPLEVKPTLPLSSAPSSSSLCKLPTLCKPSLLLTKKIDCSNLLWSGRGGKVPSLSVKPALKYAGGAILCGLFAYNLFPRAKPLAESKDLGQCNSSANSKNP